MYVLAAATTNFLDASAAHREKMGAIMQFRLFASALLLPALCFATSIVRVSLEQTIAQSEWIVEGKVVRNWSDWDSAHRFIWTHTEIAVRNHWKGTTGSTITVTEPGGVVNDMQLDVAGMVRYTPGEHVVVFLYRTPIGFIRTTGLTQGKLQVDERGRVHTIQPHAMLVDAAGAKATGHSISELEATPLESVHARVAGLVKTEVRK